MATSSRAKRRCCRTHWRRLAWLRWSFVHRPKPKPSLNGEEILEDCRACFNESGVIELITILGEVNGVIREPVVDNFQGHGFRVINRDGGQVMAILLLNVLGRLWRIEAFVGYVENGFVKGMSMLADGFIVLCDEGDDGSVGILFENGDVVFAFG